MGEVYEAFDTVKDRVVALKLLPAELAKDPVFQQRFRHESRAAARLAEPHVIPIHDWGEIDGVLYIDMRLVRGRDLRSLLREKGALSPLRAVVVVEQIAAALDAAHAEGLVHRDVKPANILVTPSDFAYLADFGIARSAGDPGLTDTGAAVGSYSYIAPERLDIAPVAGTADVYSLTCVLYECLTGAQPFPAAAISVLIRAHLSTPPPRPSAERSGLPSAMDDVVARGMAKDPADRYPTARALAIAARAALTAPPVRDAASPPAPPTVVFPSVEPGDKHADPPADDSTTRRIPNPMSPDARPAVPRPTVGDNASAAIRRGPDSGPNPRRTGQDSDSLPPRGHRTSHGEPRPRTSREAPSKVGPPRSNPSRSGPSEVSSPAHGAAEAMPRSSASHPNLPLPNSSWPQAESPSSARSGLPQVEPGRGPGGARSDAGQSGVPTHDPAHSNAVPTIDLAALGSGGVAGSSAPTVGLDAVAGNSSGTGPRAGARDGSTSRPGAGAQTAGRVGPMAGGDPVTVDMNAARPTIPAPAVASFDARAAGMPGQRRRAQSRIVPPGQFGGVPHGRVDETAVTMERSALASAAPAPARARRGRRLIWLLVLAAAAIVAGVLGWVVRGGGAEQPSPVPSTGIRLPDGARACTTTEPAAGRFTASAVGTAVTSCPFAEAVRTAYGAAAGDAGGEHEVSATSPVNGREYTMHCVAGADFVTCEGGENAVVYLY
ncbi:protein kinase [Nocardia sp. NEAU-351]|uniref:non-specific serine/threonine protein kinase n=2 Tax=Nocardia bovistercoris TaxID=2785916 RepID=A0A931N837_9NOCA|nr:protein kinase [Nocardia bovistercoris]